MTSNLKLNNKKKNTQTNTQTNINNIKILSEKSEKSEYINEIDFIALRKQKFGPKYKIIDRTKPEFSESDNILKEMLKTYSNNGKFKTNNISNKKIDELFDKICSEPILEEEYDKYEDILNGLGKYFTITSGPDNTPVIDKNQIINTINSVHDSISIEFLQIHKQINELPKIAEYDEQRDILTNRFTKITQILANLIKYRLS